MKNDHHLHTVLTFDNHLNIDVLKRAVMQSTQKLPLLLCHFKETKKGLFGKKVFFCGGFGFLSGDAGARNRSGPSTCYEAFHRKWSANLLYCCSD